MPQVMALLARIAQPKVAQSMVSFERDDNLSFLQVAAMMLVKRIQRT